MRRALPLAIAATLVPTIAFAHTEHEVAAGFLHGFEHPMGGTDHMLAMAVIGVFAFVLGGRALWQIPLAFVGMMILGFALGVGRIEVPFVELGIALSSVAIGVAAAIGRPMPLGVATAFVGAFAIFHGHAHATEMPAASDGLTFVAGFVAATAFLHAAGILMAHSAASLTGRFGRPLTRGTGALLALGGVASGWL